jgi:hypothetical protein
VKYSKLFAKKSLKLVYVEQVESVCPMLGKKVYMKIYIYSYLLSKFSQFSFVTERHVRPVELPQNINLLEKRRRKNSGGFRSVCIIVRYDYNFVIDCT